MKKLFAFVIAAAMTVLTSCTSGKNPENAVLKPVEEIPAEPIFTEYSSNDFTKIDVKINKQETSGDIVKLYEYDLSEITFEPTISPCKAEDEREKSLDRLPPYIAKDVFEEKCDEPFGGSVDLSTVCGDKLYFSVNFDDLCNSNIFTLGSHCFQLWEYNFKTGEKRLLLNYSSADRSYSFYNMKYAKGSLWLAGFNGSTVSIFRVNEEKGELENALDDTMTNDKPDFFIMSDCGERLIITAQKLRENEGEEVLFEYRLYEYDGEGWLELDRSEKFNYLYSGGIWSVDTNEKKYVTVESDKLRLDTGLRGTELKAISENRLTFITEDSVSTIMYVFDTEKKERYTLNLNGMGTYLYVASVGENLFIWDPDGITAMYLIPELGAAFSFDKLPCREIQKDYGKIWALDSDNYLVEDIDEPAEHNLMKTLYILE